MFCMGLVPRLITQIPGYCKKTKENACSYFFAFFFDALKKNT